MTRVAMIAGTLLALLGAASALADLASGAPAVCALRASGALPDPSCTPGATYSAVTQRTIHRTICVSGWAGTIRPDVRVTEPLKFASMRRYGLSTVKGEAAKYEFDHLVPLELGGAPLDLRNLWPEPRAGADGSYAKDGIENRLNREVCGGKMTLAAARKIMRTDWRAGR